MVRRPSSDARGALLIATPSAAARWARGRRIFRCGNAAAALPARRYNKRGRNRLDFEEVWRLRRARRDSYGSTVAEEQRGEGNLERIRRCWLVLLLAAVAADGRNGWRHAFCWRCRVLFLLHHPSYLCSN